MGVSDTAVPAFCTSHGAFGSAETTISPVLTLCLPFTTKSPREAVSPLRSSSDDRSQMFTHALLWCLVEAFVMVCPWLLEWKMEGRSHRQQVE